MGFWDLFKTDQAEDDTHGQLHKKIKELLPTADENKLLQTACTAGLLARVALTDMQVHDSEVEDMRNALKIWGELNEEEAHAVAKLAIDEVKKLAGLENHKYCQPLNEILSKEQRYSLLKSLFAVAASDGNVENKEAEEIRLIATGLLLEHKHFISAKATILDKLGALKN